MDSYTRKIWVLRFLYPALALFWGFTFWAAHGGLVWLGLFAFCVWRSAANWGKDIA